MAGKYYSFPLFFLFSTPFPMGVGWGTCSTISTPFRPSQIEIMESLQFGSLNVRGLNIPNGRSQVLYHMHKQHAYILFLQKIDLKA